MNKMIKSKTLSYIILISYSLLALLPIMWMFSTAFKTNEKVYDLPPRWIPDEPTLSNFRQILSSAKGTNFGYYILNSIIIASLTTLICVIVGSMAAYSFSRYEVPGSGLLMLLILGSRMIAPTALIIPFLVIARNFGIMDTRIVLIAANLYMQLPLYIWMMKGYMDGIPKQIDDSAKIDGCNKFQVFYLMILRLSWPGIVSFAILVFLFTWNDFIFALTLTLENSKTLTVGMFDFFSDTTIFWSNVSAAGVLSIIPALIFVLFFQKYLVKGLVEGAIKG